MDAEEGELWTKPCIDINQSARVESEEEERADMLRGIHERHERIVIATILVSILVLLTPIAAKALNVGDQAPDFLAFGTVGESVRLSDYQGKKNVLIFFFVRAFGGV
jgi:AhpC/TSA family